MSFNGCERHDDVQADLYEVSKKLQLALAVKRRIYNAPIYRAQIPAKLAFTAGVSIPSSERTTTASVAHASQFGLQKNH